LGIATAYYGTVEAQGRGTLHCHMMVWVAGSLNPNEIKAKAMENGGNLAFQKRLISFLEDTISTSVPTDPRPELETPLSKFHPSATRGPGPNIRPADLQDAEAKDFHNLAERWQRHRHTFTCYKYWKGYPDRKECEARESWRAFEGACVRAERRSSGSGTSDTGTEGVSFPSSEVAGASVGSVWERMGACGMSSTPAPSTSPPAGARDQCPAPSSNTTS
jgi:hypothetical protein